MSIYRILKGSGSHRILVALLGEEHTSRELKKIVSTVNGTARFELEYMSRLEANGYVSGVRGFWFITDKGRKRCADLDSNTGPPVAGPRISTWGMNEYKVERPPVLRPGSMDFMQYPSRQGNRLYYRDGRVVIVEE